jgi:hypothetical protein
VEDAGVDQGQVRRRATFCPPSLACLPAHPAGAGDRNLSFVLAPPSVPSNLNVYGEGLVRLGILQSSASVWNGEFSEAQWAALLAWGKVPPPPPPLLQPLVHMASPPLLPAPAIFLVRVGLDNIRTLYILAALQVCASACQSARAESARTRTRRARGGRSGCGGGGGIL